MERLIEVPDIHPSAVIGHGVNFGVNVKVWSHAVIGQFARIGDDCVIGSSCYVGWGTVMGQGCRMNHGSFLPNHSRVGNHVFFGPNVTCTDDRFPRAGNPDYIAEPPIFEDYCSIGAAAVILPGVKIGKHALVGAGCVVVKDVLPHAIVVGNPSKIIRSVHEPRSAILP